MIGRLLCRLGRHDWRLVSVQTHWSGVNYTAPVWTYHCRRCPLARAEGNP